MKSPITTQQAMLHPAVVATINLLSEMVQHLQDENDALKAAVADEREACAKVCANADKSTHPADLAEKIKARGNT